MKADYKQIDQLVTREQILAAQGVELSLLVSKYVMHDSQIINISGKDFEIPSKDYAIDTAAALEIAEMAVPDITINYLDERIHPIGWHCNFKGYHVHGCKTVPEAICKAALLAVLEVGSNAS